MMDQQSREPWAEKIYLGEWVDGQRGIATVVEPATGDELARIGVSGPSDVDAAVQSARLAQRRWADTPFDKRAAVFYDAARLIGERSKLFNYWNVRECGSIEPKASWELNASREHLITAASLPLQSNGMLFPSSVPGRVNAWHRIPVGIVGVITPWNFPLVLAIRTIAPALALGNAVILKPDPHSAVTGGALVAQLFEDAGLPRGLLHVLPGGVEAGEALVQHPVVKMISFTGSTVVGRQIGEICGRMLKKTSLELGGNNPFIVLPDADVNKAASCGAWGAFLHQGQICMQAGRHLVHRSVADEYISKLAARAGRLSVGNPAKGQVHLGPLINERQAARVETIVRESVDIGAVLVTGGKRTGNFFEPTVLMEVTADMPAFTDELFGPVAPVTVYDSIDEAIELVHASDYGLAAAIHSKSVSAAIALAKRLRCGMVHVNDQPVNTESQVPFGGMGASGNSSRFGGPANIEEFTTSQWISSVETPSEYPF
ncbi:MULTISPECIES: benzaldehyde dehydrogenase [unclassified Caballeronia]|uniref:benzaldehyde dehydrogenase n=1 Tax=unclassified Caballeronia TaxID=2646786 RepID=UPI00029BC935|nr:MULTISPECIES: benzaldehyde dehydrogenase [unclassified Caballeronia]EKS70269.1 benzaldehyde dehydrogenase [Burkholderia sp. SJ98]MCE4546458.1 benzaldehyde dehydrogenase [Caballeronia sp. PC1]MCE4573068.1 benzaldehyde dehydrogenase [Caballeronia sp. CLC5]